MFSIIACIGKNGELGLNGDLVFHIREDMKFFKEMTMGHAVLMGAKTFESLPGALAGRKNYVVTHHPEKLPEGVEAVKDLKSFIKEHLNSDEEIFVIGGAGIYSELLAFSKTLYLTEVNRDARADVYFPQFDKTMYNKSIIKEGHQDDLAYSFVKYTRKY